MGKNGNTSTGDTIFKCGFVAQHSLPIDDTRFDVDHWTVSRSRQGNVQANEIIANQTTGDLV